MRAFDNHSTKFAQDLPWSGILGPASTHTIELASGIVARMHRDAVLNKFLSFVVK